MGPHLGAVLGAVLGSIWEATWEPSWGILGPSRGPSRGQLGASSWGHLGGLLGAHLGSTWHLILEPPLGIVLGSPRSLVATRGHPAENNLRKMGGACQFQTALNIAGNISASALAPLRRFALGPSAMAASLACAIGCTPSCTLGDAPGKTPGYTLHLQGGGPYQNYVTKQTRYHHISI